VALWAQLSSVIELVAGVALAGIGIGLAVLVVQARHPAEERSLLAESIKLGLAVALPVLLAVAAASWRFPDLLAGNEIPPSLLVLAAASGWVAVVPGMIGDYWLGRQRRDLLLWLALASAALPAIAAAAVPREHLLAWVALCFAAPVIIAPFVLQRKMAPRPPSPERRSNRKALLRYATPGIVIGLMSPASMVAARSIVSSALSWQDAGLLQSLWRLSDWVASVAAGLLSVYFLPRLTASCGTRAFHEELKRAALLTVVPAAAAFVLLFAFQRPILSSLYDSSFRMSDATVALFFAGSLVRVAAWVPLFGLYAMKRTTAIAVGEVLSLPLFALLLAGYAAGLSLEKAGALWLASYVVYGAFNLWAALRAPRKAAL